jgi:hypothetical protein
MIEFNNLENRNEKILFLLLFIFLIAYKFFTFRMFDIGGDAINYWFASKHIAYGVPYIELDHQTSRFGLILPLAVIQMIFSSHPAVSLIIPNLFFVIHIFLIYKIGSMIKNPTIGFFSALLFMLCPHIIRFGTQTVPEAVGGPLATAAFYYLLRYHQDDKKEIFYLAISAFMLFWAYCAHELDIFFMPAFLMVIFLFKRNIRHLVLYSSILFVLFLFETSVFFYYTHDVMARYHAITGHHFTLEKFVPISFWGLFERYTKTQLWWRIPFYLYLIILYPVWRAANLHVRGLVLSSAIFFLLMLFAVKSINPIIPALAYKEVHLLFALPFMIMVIVIFFYDGFVIVKNYLSSKLVYFNKISEVKFIALSVFLLIFGAFVVTSLDVLPKKVEPYYNSPLKITDHKLVRFFTYYQEFNDAYTSGVPIVSDYIYTVKEDELHKKVQLLRSEGKNLAEALDIVGVDMKYYFTIRPNMPQKSLNAVRKIFLRENPLKIPEISVSHINGSVVNYIINKKYEMDAVKKISTEKILYATKGELKAVYGYFVK